MSNVRQQIMHRAIKPTLLAVVIGAATFQSAFAACDKVVREDELQECLAAELAVVDKELNSTYARLRGGMKKEGAETLELLTKAQKLWVSLRDADCELEAESHKGGTGYQAVYLQCSIDRTRQRISEFKRSTHWPRK
jgi:uncharacterized protein YecT (DUF1311 family)